MNATTPPNEAIEPILLTAQEAAVLLRIRSKNMRRTLSFLRQRGLKHLMVSKEYYYPRQGVIDFINNCGGNRDNKNV